MVLIDPSGLYHFLFFLSFEPPIDEPINAPIIFKGLNLKSSPKLRHYISAFELHTKSFYQPSHQNKGEAIAKIFFLLQSSP